MMTPENLHPYNHPKPTSILTRACLTKPSSEYELDKFNLSSRYQSEPKTTSHSWGCTSLMWQASFGSTGTRAACGGKSRGKGTESGSSISWAPVARSRWESKEERKQWDKLSVLKPCPFVGFFIPNFALEKKRVLWHKQSSDAAKANMIYCIYTPLI